MNPSIPFPMRRAGLTILCAAILQSAVWATPSISTTTRFGTDAADTGASGGSCRAPCPVVIDAGSATSSTYQTGDAGQLGIRITEQALTGCTYDHDTGGGAGVDPTITCTDGFSQFSWELLTISTNGATDWTASGADAGAYYHDGGDGIHGKPIGVRVDESDFTEGTCGSLADGEWCWGDADTIGGNRVYVQDASGDPDGQTTGFVKVIYGDGEYIYVSHADWTPGYVYVKDKTSDDVIVLGEAPNGASEDESSVTVNQTVNAFTDLEYIWSVSCTGGVCVEDITNGDQRPGAASTSIDETKGYGPIWAFVFAEGFTEATITLTVNDLANGGTDTQEITVSETDWTGESVYYIDSVNGSESNDGSTALLAKAKWETGVNWLRTATAPATLYVAKGSSFTLAASVTNWSGSTGDRRIKPYGSGANPIVTTAGFAAFRVLTTASADLRASDLTIVGSAGSNPWAMPVERGVCVRVNVTAGAGNIAFFPDASSGLDSSDAVIWDCTGTASGAGYAIFGGGSTDIDEVNRRAVFGSILTNTGSESCVRMYNADSVFAYNYITGNGTASKTALRIAAGNSLVCDNYVYQNYVRIGTSALYGIELFLDSGGSHGDVLIDGCYIESLGSAASPKGGIRVATTGNLRVQNTILTDINQEMSNNSGFARKTAYYHNNSYSTLAVGMQTFKAGDYPCLKAVNNTAQWTANTSGSKWVETNQPIAITQIVSNIRSFSTNPSTAWDCSDGSGGFGAGGWVTKTHKAAQDQNGVATNPGFTDEANKDFSLEGGAAAINAAFSLATVKRDYRGYIRPEPSGSLKDIGAYEYGATLDGTASGACCTTVELSCSIITDGECAATQWLEGDTCADCEWQCCQGDGTCTDETESACDGLSGTFTWGTLCSGDCATGACCDGSDCTETTEEGCADTYRGDGTDCDPNPCAAMIQPNHGVLDKIFRHRGPFGGPFGYGYDDTGHPWDKP